MPLRHLSLCCLVLAAAACGARSGLAEQGQGGASAGPMPVACVPGNATLTPATPSVLFLIDRSSSMNDALDSDTSGKTRWEILTSALASTLPEVDDTMAIGALLFPAIGAPAMGCSVSSEPDLSLARHHVADLLALMRSTSPRGATPTANAVSEAEPALLAVRAATTARAILLATDGGPNCNPALDPATCRCVFPGGSCDAGPHVQVTGEQCIDEKRTVDELARVFREGIPTYVLGIQAAGDEQFTDVLDAMATAGGRPKQGSERFYAGRNAADVRAAIAAIRDQVGRCTYLVSSVPNGGGKIAVTLDGAKLAENDGPDGWSWSSETNGEVVLGAAACEKASAASPGGLAASVTCK